MMLKYKYLSIVPSVGVGGPKNMKYNWVRTVAIFLDLLLTGQGGGMAPLALPGCTIAPPFMSYTPTDPKCDLRPL